jgi:GT2 family glycosyltransferase/Tfp pilus assembly protein PilF
MKLSVVMMIKNESKHLERCLTSVKPILSAIEAELVIVDTGSEDDSVAIAKRYTDKVYSHPWNNDFAAMRNITINYASGKWIFVLDGDEVIENPEEFINFFKSGNDRKFNTGIIRMKNYTTENETKYTLALIPRLFKKDKDFGYIGAIHEQAKLKEPVCYLDANVLHYGYNSADTELMERKFSRNIQILKNELKKDPENIYYWFQIAQSYAAHGDNEEALSADLMAYEFAKRQEKLSDNMYIYTHLALVYFSSKKYDELEKICLEALAIKDGYIDFYYFLAKAQQQLLKNMEAINSYHVYLDMVNHYESYPGSKDIRVFTCTIDSYENAYADLCTLYYKNKQYEKVLEYKDKIKAHDLLNIALPSIISAYIKLNKYSELKDFYDSIILVEYEKLMNDFTNNLENEMSSLSKEEKDIIIDIFSNGESVYSLLNLIRTADELEEISSNITYIERIEKQDFNKLPLYYGEILYYLLKCKHLSISILNHMRDTALDAYFNFLIMRYKKQCADLVVSYIQENIVVDTIDNIMIRKSLRKLLLLSGIFKGERYGQIFIDYIQDGIKYINYVYNKDIIIDEQIYYVKNDEEAMFIYMDRAKEIMTKDKVEYIRYLKKALNAYPEMVKGIELLMKDITEITGNDKVSLDEFEDYKKQFKESIQAFIEKGLLDDVKAMLVEYEKIVKDDIDIYSIKGVIAIMEGDMVAAEKILLEGIDIDAQNFDLLYNLGYFYQSNNQNESAIKYFKKAFQNANGESDLNSIYEILQELGVQESRQGLLKSKAPTTSIIILTYNNLKYNKQCIESIRKYTKEGTYEIIVVDNQSTDGTADWLKKQKDIKVILNDENFGFPKGCNQGIELADKDNDILLLNNDTVVTPNWLINLEKCLYSEKTVGAVGAITNSCSNNQAIPVRYSNINDMIDFAKSNNISNPSKWEERLRLVGFCMLIKNEVVEKVGLLDEIFSPGNFEDDDYSFRIRKEGYKLILCKDSFIHHYGSASFGKEANKFKDLLIINREKFIKKWGVDPYSIVELKNNISNVMEKIDKLQSTEQNLKIVNPNKAIKDRKMRFLLRRIENHIHYDESIFEVINELQNKRYQSKEVIQIIQTHIINKEMVLNEIALGCYREGMVNIAIEMLMKSYEINSQNLDTVYNLSYISYKLGDIETAMTFLKSTKDKDDSIVNLMNEIMGEHQ